MKLCHFLVLAIPALAGCANFRHLAADLKPFENDYRISGVIENADDYKVPVRVTVVEGSDRGHR